MPESSFHPDTIPGAGMPQEETPRIEDLFATNVDDAFEKLDDFLNAIQEKQNEFTLLQRRWEALKADKGKKTVSSADAELKENQIADAFWQSIRQIKQIIPNYFRFTGLSPHSRAITDEAEILKAVTKEMLEGRYKDLSKIAEGSSGLFFRAENVHTGQEVVVMAPRLMRLDDDALEAEMSRILRIRHRNIIRIIDCNFKRLPAFVILEFIDGIKLSDALRVFGGFQFDDALFMLRQLSDALEYLRKHKVWHANIRLSKIYIDHEGQPMISPMDVLRTNSERNRHGKSRRQDLRSLDRFLEDSRYLSPEALDESLFLVDKPQDIRALERSDQFSLGLLFLEMLTAKPLFKGKTVSAVFESRKEFFAQPAKKIETALKAADLPPSLVAVLKKMLSHSSEQRYSGIQQAIDALEKIEARLPYNCLAKESYQFCRRHEFDLIEAGYNAFFKKHPEVKDHFLREERQRMMLGFALKVVLNIEQKKEVFRRILQMDAHSGYTTPDLYRDFLHALRDTICNKIAAHKERWPPEKVEKARNAWDGKIELCMQAVLEHIHSPNLPR